MIKWALRITVFGIIMHVVAPGALGDSINGLLQGIGLVIAGSSKVAVKQFVSHGWSHPTEGAIGWDIIRIIKGLF